MPQCVPILYVIILSASNCFLLFHLLSVASDIDECTEGRDYCNKETEVCVNERGGYRCVPASELSASSSVAPNPLTTTTARPSPRIPCPRGYIFSDDSRRCIGDRKQSIDFKTYALYYFYK